MKLTPRKHNRIESGAPVLTPTKRLAVVRCRQHERHWKVETTEGEQVFLAEDLKLLQPNSDLTVGKGGVDGMPVITHRGYGVIRGSAFPWIPNRMYRWDVELIGSEGSVLHASRGEITVLTPVEDDPERAEEPPKSTDRGQSHFVFNGDVKLSLDEAAVPELSNPELAAALEDAVGFSARYNISETLRPLIEQHAARLMVEQWRRANPAIVKTWYADDPMEEDGD